MNIPGSAILSAAHNVAGDGPDAIVIPASVPSGYALQAKLDALYGYATGFAPYDAQKGA